MEATRESARTTHRGNADSWIVAGLTAERQTRDAFLISPLDDQQLPHRRDRWRLGDGERARALEIAGD